MPAQLMIISNAYAADDNSETFYETYEDSVLVLK